MLADRLKIIRTYHAYLLILSVAGLIVGAADPGSNRYTRAKEELKQFRDMRSDLGDAPAYVLERHSGGARMPIHRMSLHPDQFSPVLWRFKFGLPEWTDGWYFIYERPAGFRKLFAPNRTVREIIRDFDAVIQPGRDSEDRPEKPVSIYLINNAQFKDLLIPVFFSRFIEHPPVKPNEQKRTITFKGSSSDPVFDAEAFKTSWPTWVWFLFLLETHGMARSDPGFMYTEYQKSRHENHEVFPAVSVILEEIGDKRIPKAISYLEERERQEEQSRGFTLLEWKLPYSLMKYMLPVALLVLLLLLRSHLLSALELLETQPDPDLYPYIGLNRDTIVNVLIFLSLIMLPPFAAQIQHTEVLNSIMADVPELQDDHFTNGDWKAIVNYTWSSATAPFQARAFWPIWLPGIIIIAGLNVFVHLENLKSLLQEKSQARKSPVKDGGPRRIGRRRRRIPRV